MPSSKQDDNFWSVLRMLEWATDYFTHKQVPDPRHSIEWLLADVLKCKRLDLYLKFGRPLSPDELDQIRPLVKRRAAHEPLQYITGTSNFMGCHLRVTPDVLIPRIETEQLVEILLDSNKENSKDPLTLLDIGTGSGCIPIAIKKHRPNWNCHAVDISDDALSIAKQNAEKNELEIHFNKGDIFNLSALEPPDKGWDLIVSNPPYISPDEKDSLEKQVKEFEPGISLFHTRPLEVYREIIAYAKRSGSHLFLELNDRFADQILEMSTDYFSSAEIKKDLDNNARFLIAHSSA